MRGYFKGSKRESEVVKALGPLLLSEHRLKTLCYFLLAHAQSFSHYIFAIFSYYCKRGSSPHPTSLLLHKSILIRDHDPRTKGCTGVPLDACMSALITVPNELLFLIVWSESLC